MSYWEWCTYDFVPARQGNGATLNGEGCAVATCIASDDINAAVSGDEGRGGKGEDENLGKHCD